MISHKKIIVILFSIALATPLITGSDFYFEKNKNKNRLTLNISGAVLPHHNIVGHQRAEFFSVLASNITPPDTIILLSPNHYRAGQQSIQTTNQEWKLNQGKIIANQNVISYLAEHNLAANNSSSFINEHGIYNILSDIYNNFPHAKIVPIIFDGATQTELQDLKQGLMDSCLKCLMIASVDFSHYQPALLGQLHDDLSIRGLQMLDTANLFTKSEVDSGPALALLAMWAKDHNTLHFELKNHTNSGIIAQNPDIESTTHIFGWYEKGAPAAPEKSVGFLVGGDMMFARGINQIFGNDFNGAFSQFGDRVFWGTDASAINLEGSITQKPIPKDTPSNTMNFKFSPSIVKTLSFLHINAASQANNHSDNAGQEGIDTTRSLLRAAHIQPFGGPTDSSVTRIAYVTGNEMSLAIIGINLTYPGQDAATLVPLITELKKDPPTRVLVMPHWGEEYMSTHSKDQAYAAHLWIDAGADMIIGSHPHVIQDAELYRGAPIIYSLGNLLFDQAFSRQTQEGLLIAGKFTSDGLTFFGLPTTTIHYQPRLETKERKQEILQAIYNPFEKHIQSTPAGLVVKILK